LSYAVDRVRVGVFSRAMLLVIMGLILFLIKVRLSTRNIGHGITKILAKETNSAN